MQKDSKESSFSSRPPIYPKIVTTPEKRKSDSYNKIDALSLDFTQIHVSKNSHSPNSKSLSKRPFPLKQNSWVFEDTNKQKKRSPKKKGIGKVKAAKRIDLDESSGNDSDSSLLPGIDTERKSSLCLAPQKWRMPVSTRIPATPSKYSPKKLSTHNSKASPLRKEKKVSSCKPFDKPCCSEERIPGDGCELRKHSSGSSSKCLSQGYNSEDLMDDDDDEVLSDLDQEDEGTDDGSLVTSDTLSECSSVSDGLDTWQLGSSSNRTSRTPPGLDHSKYKTAHLQKPLWLHSGDHMLAVRPAATKAFPTPPGSCSGQRVPPVGSSSTKGTPLVSESGGVTTPSSPLTASLFPGRPPTIHFPLSNEPYTPLSEEEQSLLKWKMSTITPNVIKVCIKRVGFKRLKKGTQWIGYWGKHMKSDGFKSVREHQKVNHFPGSFAIGRKDRLWRSLSRMQSLHGKKELDFVPQTYVLPGDLYNLKRDWEEGSHRNKWIIKPPASARGIGIKVIHKWAQLPKKKALVVQRYISNPFLINGSKFDLRVYVYVSSYDPLRIYVYPDGLARFATCKYSSAMKSLSNRFVHLTNYSINKKNVSFTPNSDESVCQGHKWGLLALWEYMKTELGIDHKPIWNSIKDLIIKTIISSEPSVVSLLKANVRNSWSCHELFGFDIMLDSNLKPWIVEVNISPSLHSNSQLDLNIKGNLVRDILNIAGFTIPLRDGSTDDMTHKDVPHLTSEERTKHAHFIQRTHSHGMIIPSPDILDGLTNDDIRILMDTEDELNRSGQFERVFPSSSSHQYLKFFEAQRYYNLLLSVWCKKNNTKQLKSTAIITLGGLHKQHVRKMC